MWALSSNMILHRSCVAGVQYTSPQKPLRTRRGSHAEWSVWACVGNTASILPGSTGNGSQFCWGIFLIPWNMPQSMRIRLPSVSRKNREPVTVPVAPKKDIVAIDTRIVVEMNAVG